MRRDDPAVPGTLIEASRKARALSHGALAARLGVSRLTLRALERGIDSRASTIRRILDALDDLAPPDLLGGAGRGPREAHALHAFDHRLHGVRAGRCTRELRVDDDGRVAISMRMEGIRSTRAGLEDAAVLADVLRLVLPPGSGLKSGAAEIARTLLVAGRVEATDAGCTHELTLSRGRHDEIGHAVTEPARSLSGSGSARDCIASGSALFVTFPVASARLLIRPPASIGAVRPVAFAWVDPLSPDDGDDRLARQASALGVRVESSSDGSIALSLAEPPTGLHLALGWRDDDRGREPDVVAKRRRVTTRRAVAIGSVLQEAREAEGLSVRGLAARMGVGPMTVSDLERGADPRGSTLRACVAALPDLSPWALLPPSSLSPAQAWTFRRDLMGCEIESETKTVEIDGDGDAAMRIETRKLRLLAPRPGPLRLHVGLSAPTITPTRARLRSVATSGDDASSLRISGITGAGGERLHQLTIPEPLARHGVSFTRVLVHPGVYSMTAAGAERRTGRPGPFHEGASFAAVLPVRVLRLVVKFPRGLWPGQFTHHVWPLTQAPDPSDAGIGAWLHPRGITLTCTRPSRSVLLEVEKPIIGAKYGIAWRLEE